MNPLVTLLDLPAAEKERLGVAHTAGEIAQQPSTWARTSNLVRGRLPEIRSFLEAAGVSAGSPATSGERPIVFLVGAGSSDYIGRCLHHLLQQEWQCVALAVSSTDLLTDFSELLLTGRKYLWISFSRSGDSPEGVAVLERALAERPEIAHLIVSCNASGRMTQLTAGRPNCLSLVLDDATNDRGLAMTSSFTNMVVAGQALAHAFSPDQYESVIEAIVPAGEDFLPVAAEVADRLAKMDFRRACFVGSGPLSGTALESALKLLELTAGRVKTMSQPTLALRHGPMAALDRETLFVGFLSSYAKRQCYEIDLLREIERKQIVGGSVAVLGNGSEHPPRFDRTEILAPPHAWLVPDLYRPALDILFGQMLGLFSSLRTGLAPDSPSPDGVISRVVQPIGIY